MPDPFDLLEEVLGPAQELGLIGPGPIASHIEHGRMLAEGLGSAPSRVLDLGSGAGLPGLVLATAWPQTSFVLLEAGSRRAYFLGTAIKHLGFSERVSVAEGRAEILGQGPLRESFELVIARLFGAPAVTAECGSPFVQVEGKLVVTEPPESVNSKSADRWPETPLAELCLKVEGFHHHETVSWAELLKQGPLGDRYPRRDGVPTKRPLW